MVSASLKMTFRLRVLNCQCEIRTFGEKSPIRLVIKSRSGPALLPHITLWSAESGLGRKPESSTISEKTADSLEHQLGIDMAVSGERANSMLYRQLSPAPPKKRICVLLNVFELIRQRKPFPIAQDLLSKQ